MLSRWRKRYVAYLSASRSIVACRHGEDPVQDVRLFDETGTDPVALLERALLATPRHARIDLKLAADLCVIERLVGATSLSRRDWNALARARNESSADRVRIDGAGKGDARIALRVSDALGKAIERHWWKLASARPWATERVDERLRQQPATAGVFAVCEPVGTTLFVAQDGVWRHIARSNETQPSARTHREAVRLAMAYGLSLDQVWMEHVQPWGDVIAALPESASGWQLTGLLGALNAQD